MSVSETDGEYSDADSSICSEGKSNRVQKLAGTLLGRKPNVTKPQSTSVSKFRSMLQKCSGLPEKKKSTRVGSNKEIGDLVRDVQNDFFESQQET